MTVYVCSNTTFHELYRQNALKDPPCPRQTHTHVHSTSCRTKHVCLIKYFPNKQFVLKGLLSGSSVCLSVTGNTFVFGVLLTDSTVQGLCPDGGLQTTEHRHFVDAQ